LKETQNDRVGEETKSARRSSQLCKETYWNDQRTDSIIQSDGRSKTSVGREKDIAFTDKLRMSKELDEILNILCGDKDIEAEIDGEIEESENIKAEVQTLILRINSNLGLNIEGSLPSTSSAPQSYSSATATANTKQVQLPRLEVPKFSGKVHKWQEFWDRFSSAIDGNTQLSEVDKFSYLCGLLLEPARSTVQGFALTADNYKAAVDLLKKHYGKKILIQRAYVNELLNIVNVYNERDTIKLCKMYDFVET
jgi:hypothetical protein